MTVSRLYHVPSARSNRMAKFAFQVTSVGVLAASAAEIYLAIDTGSNPQLYRLMCTGSDIGLTQCKTRKAIDIPDAMLPSFLDNQPVRFRLEGGVLTWGMTEVEFSLYSENQSDSSYSFKRRVNIGGGCIGGV